MTSMDLGIPELPAGRDAASDATRRRGKADSADFAMFLDRAVDDQDQQPRDPATEKTAPAAGSDKPRDKVPSVEHADDSDDQGEDKNAVTANATPAQEPVKQAQPDTKTETVEKSPTPAQSPEHKNANEAPASAPSEQLAEEAAAATAPPQPATTPPQAGTDAKAAQTTPAPAAAQPPSAPADDAVANENADPVAVPADKPAETVVAPATSFAEQLAAATTKPAETPPANGKPKADAAASTDAPGKPTTAATPHAPAAVPAPVAAAEANDKKNGNSDQTANLAPQTQPTAQPAPAVPVQPAAASTAPAQPAASDTPDDAQILAVLRAAAPQDQSPARPATPKPDDKTGAMANLLKDVDIDAKPAAEAQKSDAPARPFGALAPGLGLAAQITAQQTPEQANAAERLAQLAASTKVDGDTALPKSSDAKPAETVVAAKPLDQPAPIDAPAQRQAIADVSAADAAARSARPNLHPVVAQVAAQVAQAAADGTDRINIRLSPHELGRIDVKLDFGPDGRVQAVFAAERPQTMELLQRDARDLERALQDAGLRADSGSLSFNLRGQGRDGRDESMPQGGRQDNAPTELAASQLNAYAAGSGGSGRLDIRI